MLKVIVQEGVQALKKGTREVGGGREEELQAEGLMMNASRKRTLAAPKSLRWTPSNQTACTYHDAPLALSPLGPKRARLFKHIDPPHQIKFPYCILPPTNSSSITIVMSLKSADSLLSNVSFSTFERSLSIEPCGVRYSRSLLP